MKKLFSYFVQGIVYIVPVFVTIYVVYIVVRFFDTILHNYISDKYFIPGSGIIIAFLVVTLVGFIIRHLLPASLKLFTGRLLNRAPFLHIIYSSLKDLLNAFVGKEKKFTQPVLFVLNKENGIEKLGFLTRQELNDFGLKEKVAVYCPHSYNFSGELFIVPKENVRIIDQSPADIMKFIISGGITSLSD